MIIGVSVRRVLFMVHSIIRLPNLCGAQNLVSDYPSTISSSPKANPQSIELSIFSKLFLNSMSFWVAVNLCQYNLYKMSESVQSYLRNVRVLDEGIEKAGYSRLLTSTSGIRRLREMKACTNKKSRNSTNMRTNKIAPIPSGRASLKRIT